LAVRRAPVKRFPYHLVYLDTQEAIRILAVPLTAGGRCTGSTSRAELNDIQRAAGRPAAVALNNRAPGIA